MKLGVKWFVDVVRREKEGGKQTPVSVPFFQSAILAYWRNSTILGKKKIEFSPAPHDIIFNDFQKLIFNVCFLYKNYKESLCDYNDAILIKFNALFIVLC